MLSTSAQEAAQRCIRHLSWVAVFPSRYIRTTWSMVEVSGNVYLDYLPRYSGQFLNTIFTSTKWQCPITLNIHWFYLQLFIQNSYYWCLKFYMVLHFVLVSFFTGVWKESISTSFCALSCQYFLPWTLLQDETFEFLNTV